MKVLSRLRLQRPENLRRNDEITLLFSIRDYCGLINAISQYIEPSIRFLSERSDCNLAEMEPKKNLVIKSVSSQI